MANIVPIQQIPPELLTEIFLRFSDVTHDISRIGESAWILTHVCQLWRDIALRTPPLWASFAYTNSTRSPLKLIRKQLALSKREPLSFRVDFACDALIPIEVLLMETIGLCVFDILVAEADRWKNVTLHIPDDALGLFVDIITTSQDEFSLLQSFSIYRQRVTYTEDIAIQSSMFISAPTLSAVKLFPFIDVMLPWSQLTEIETNRLPIDVEFMIIRQSPFLRKLVTTLRYGREELTVSTAEPVVHTALRVFAPMYTSILPHLVLSSLTELIFDLFVDRDPPNALSDFIGRSGSLLRCLSLRVHLPSPATALPTRFEQQFVNTFSKMHVLVELKIEFNFTPMLEYEQDLGPILLDALQSSPLVLPKLERLEIRTKRCICSLEDIVGLVQYRWVKALVDGGSVTRLKAVDVECDGLRKMSTGDAFHCLENLRRFKKEGLEFKIAINGVPFDWESYTVGPPRFDSLEVSDTFSDTDSMD
ncbi:hypothetical protein IW261DRAFT_723104 [Armillaria novae-zelandiae]|uniref:F-box domain-containing protein n=1 Tax=Armillaria novae-zelandiae TaxID=153914 RepID=A0AA39U885_9AGAR|nr:hypothetical protein IW261DRAFT_723104 [Armillaria novae-zelandiae]